jgi:hypothetical protein
MIAAGLDPGSVMGGGVAVEFPFPLQPARNRAAAKRGNRAILL